MQDKKLNSINLIRMIAAIQVFFGHAIPAFGITATPLMDCFLIPIFIFEGVPVFFCLSGFLIWDSIERTKNLKQFIEKRVFRLYPELWCGVLINMLLMCFLYSDGIEWLSFIAFQFTQGTILQFWTPDSLRGYATGTPNGPLWTICVMVQAYIALWFIYRFLHKKKLSYWIPLLIVTTSINMFRPFFADILPQMIYKITFYMFSTHIWLFLVGAFVNEYFDKVIVCLKRFWWLFLIISQAAVRTGFDIGSYKTIKSLFLGLGVIGIAYALPKLNIKYDLSYGLYIYHMIVINVMVVIGVSSNPIWMIVALIISLILSAISYFTVGYISRKLRKKVQLA